MQLPFDEPSPQAPAEPASPVPGGRLAPYSVSDLTTRVRSLLEEAFFEVWVEGELSNCRRWTTGHLYFTLKDATAQLKGVMFRSDVRRLRFAPEDGLHVVARGRLSVYDPKGEYQIVCAHLEPRGFGGLQLAFEQLKQTLQREGLFDAARKRPLPVLPRKIGIVTSASGAAVRDIIKVLRRRYPGAHLILSPTRVQGEGAADEIARALHRLGRVPDVDVAIVGRGGGSIEDLWAFNEEVVARAIAAAPMPIVSAVGHETDVTIADFVADLRAPTPSAAAEIVVARRDDFQAFLDRQGERLAGAMYGRLDRLHRRVDGLMRQPAIGGWPARVAMRGRHLADLGQEMQRAAHRMTSRRRRLQQTLHGRLEARSPGQALAAVRRRTLGAGAQLRAAMLKRYHRTDARFRHETARLESLSPLAVLARGYSMTWNADRSALVRDAGSVAPGARIHVALERGELACEVTTVHPARRNQG